MFIENNTDLRNEAISHPILVQMLNIGLCYLATVPAYDDTKEKAFSVFYAYAMREETAEPCAARSARRPFYKFSTSVEGERL